MNDGAGEFARDGIIGGCADSLPLGTFLLARTRCLEQRRYFGITNLK